MPDGYVCGLMGDVNDERNSGAERVVIMAPAASRVTDTICVRVYLANEINIMIQPKNM